MFKKMNQGFTIIELLMVIFIMMLLSGLSLFKYQDYRHNVNLTNISLDAALVIREAQTYGVSTVESNASDFSHGYGVYFNKTTPSSFTFFTDSVNDDFWYNSSAESIRSISLEDGYSVHDVCVGPLPDPNCGPTQVAVVYKRPNLAAHISVQNGGSEYQAAHIIFMAPDGSTSTVHATVTGQIYVD